MKWTIKELEARKAAGTIRGWVEMPKSGKTAKNAGQNKPQTKKGTKIKGWITLNLTYWCKVNGYKLQEEHRFDESRKWRFDWFIPELNCGIEYEGLMSSKSRHTTIKGYSGDTEKYRAAAIKGIITLRYTALNYKSIITDLEKLKK